MNPSLNIYNYQTFGETRSRGECLLFITFFCPTFIIMISCLSHSVLVLLELDHELVVCVVPLPDHLQLPLAQPAEPLEVVVSLLQPATHSSYPQAPLGRRHIENLPQIIIIPAFLKIQTYIKRVDMRSWCLGRYMDSNKIASDYLACLSVHLLAT